MRRLILSFCLGWACSCTDQSDQNLDRFEWLVGKWKRIGMDPGKEAYEVWSRAGDRLIGTGMSMKNGDTTFIEKLSIQLVDSEFYYVADVSQNPEPTQFKIDEIRSGYFKSSNPSHDFPKEIKYELKGDQLIAEISGDDGAIPFIFEKVE